MMRRTAILLIALPLVLLSCISVPRRSVTIKWPESFNYMTALSEIDARLKGDRYTGDMSLKVAYPHRLFFEVYSTFGTTILCVDRSEDHFIMHTGNETLTDENEFFRLFNVRIDDIIEDLTLKGPIRYDSGFACKERPNYTVYYYLWNDQNKICWKVKQGDFCMRFMEVSFSREIPDGKGNNGND